MFGQELYSVTFTFQFEEIADSRYYRFYEMNKMALGNN